MKIAFYQMRPFDEQAYIEQFSREFGIDYVTIPGAPCPENLDKAAGCDAVSQNPCEILPEYVEAWARMGVKYLLCRSIGYDHIPLETAKKLGMRVAHSHYPPEGVANYAIMLMLMCTRKMNQTMLRAAAQDYTLPGKMGRDLSNCTVGVIGTGKIGSVGSHRVPSLFVLALLYRFVARLATKIAVFPPGGIFSFYTKNPPDFSGFFWYNPV